jgi:hypothetical protein
MHAVQPTCLAREHQQSKHRHSMQLQQRSSSCTPFTATYHMFLSVFLSFFLVFGCCVQDRVLLALQQYLQEHSYHNTQATDLWAAMGGAGAALLGAGDCSGIACQHVVVAAAAAESLAPAAALAAHSAAAGAL